MNPAKRKKLLRIKLASMREAPVEEVKEEVVVTVPDKAVEVEQKVEAPAEEVVEEVKASKLKKVKKVVESE